MSETPNLPATFSRFGEALEIVNTRKRSSTIERIFGDIRAQIQTATEDHALVLNKANTFRVQARDAATKHAHHASAVQVAIRQGDREAATRQARERERWAAFAEHAETEAQRYNEMARLQKTFKPIMARRINLLGLYLRAKAIGSFDLLFVSGIN